MRKRTIESQINCPEERGNQHHSQDAQTGQRRQKSYADNMRGPLEFEVGDHVFLKVTPLKGSEWFAQRGKQNLKFIGPFEILQRVGSVAYCLALHGHCRASMTSFMSIATKSRVSCLLFSLTPA